MMKYLLIAALILPANMWIEKNQHNQYRWCEPLQGYNEEKFCSSFTQDSYEEAVQAAIRYRTAKPSPPDNWKRVNK